MIGFFFLELCLYSVTIFNLQHTNARETFKKRLIDYVLAKMKEEHRTTSVTKTEYWKQVLLRKLPKVDATFKAAGVDGERKYMYIVVHFQYALYIYISMFFK